MISSTVITAIDTRPSLFANVTWKESWLLTRLDLDRPLCHDVKYIRKGAAVFDPARPSLPEAEAEAEPIQHQWTYAPDAPRTVEQKKAHMIATIQRLGCAHLFRDVPLFAVEVKSANSSAEAEAVIEEPLKVAKVEEQLLKAPTVAKSAEVDDDRQRIKAALMRTLRPKTALIPSLRPKELATIVEEAELETSEVDVEGGDGEVKAEAAPEKRAVAASHPSVSRIPRLNLKKYENFLQRQQLPVSCIAAQSEAVKGSGLPLRTWAYPRYPAAAAHARRISIPGPQPRGSAALESLRKQLPRVRTKVRPQHFAPASHLAMLFKSRFMRRA
jgi:hypothetical protein